MTLKTIVVDYERLRGLIDKANNSLYQECSGVIDLIEYLEELLES